jgi:hypothetical protein
MALRSELADAEATEFQEHLSACHDCSAELAAFRALAERLDAARLQVPPRDLKYDVLARAHADDLGPLVQPVLASRPPTKLKKKVLAGIARAPGSRAAKPVAWGLAAAAVVAGAFAVTSAAQLRRTEDRLDDVRDRAEAAVDQIGPVGRTMQTLTLGAGDSETTASLVHLRHDNFRVVLDTEDMTVSPPGYHYELWLYGRRGEISMGSFRLLRPDELRVAFPVGVDPAAFPHMVVTLEPDDGDPAMSQQVVAHALLDRSDL